MAIHQRFPGLDRQTKVSLLLPRNLHDLQSSLGIVVKDCSAEQETKRYLAIVQSIEILVGGAAEVVTARHRQIGCRPFPKRAQNTRGLCPEERAERVFPAIRRTEQFK